MSETDPSTSQSFSVDGNGAVTFNSMPWPSNAGDAFPAFDFVVPVSQIPNANPNFVPTGEIGIDDWVSMNAGTDGTLDAGQENPRPQVGMVWDGAGDWVINSTTVWNDGLNPHVNHPAWDNHDPNQPTTWGGQRFVTFCATSQF